MAAFRVMVAFLLSTAPTFGQAVIPAVPPLPRPSIYYWSQETPPQPAPPCCRGAKCASPCEPAKSRH